MHTHGKAPGLAPRFLIGAALVAAVAAPAFAQQATLSLDQIERKYRTMSAVHIEKCDDDKNGEFTRTEQLCVANIYRAMYLDRD